MLQQLTDLTTPGCNHNVLRRARWLPDGKGWICADDEHPECHYRVLEIEAPCVQAKYWKQRYDRMRQMYQERFNEGLSIAAWHEKYCGAMIASKQMQQKIAELLEKIEAHPHFISAEDVARQLRPLLPRDPETPPACDHDSQKPR